MCGRYYIDTEEENVKTRAILAELEKRRLPMSDQVRTGEIYPTQIAPVILTEPDAGVTVRPMKWGFPRVGGGVVINSRSEKSDNRIAGLAHGEMPRTLARGTASQRDCLPETPENCPLLRRDSQKVNETACRTDGK